MARLSSKAIGKAAKDAFGKNTAVLVIALLFLMFAALVGTSSWADWAKSMQPSTQAVAFPLITSTLTGGGPSGSAAAAAAVATPSVIVNRGQTGAEVSPFTAESVAALL